MNRYKGIITKTFILNNDPNKEVRFILFEDLDKKTNYTLNILFGNNLNVKKFVAQNKEDAKKLAKGFTKNIETLIKDILN
tara:strand:- start:91 stop:330 length:240 start_codon:yes stop_codon:yes gene_type:complete